ncbi:hypothetical protein F0562_032320 [Nyssa sinensis]|uniref:Uncharacterized protein n=1 Tax=Nyssa sinensis TaxID=561372 RepID=A0A5J5ASC1_9ASTE|nr:hypothetical protein F0562_032320 [Nyssa sinensis]
MSGEAHPVDVPASRADAFPRDPSCFDLFLPQINNDGDLVAFIAKYQDTFPDDVIVNLGSEQSSGVPYSSECFIKFHPLVNANPLPHEYSKAELSRAFVIKDRD